VDQQGVRHKLLNFSYLSVSISSRSGSRQF
jgi:hypothetical protein